MEDAQTQLVDKLKSASNIMVTVSRDPSVDQLAALLGLTIFLNKQGKHAAAIFSGGVPSTIEFLKPEETIEKNTDSLRDFIIALDKSKADKLRYKVEDNVVRIFITPYKTSITKEDFEFSQGDFNIDLVVAIGVKKQEELDEAIVSHGRILHDATVASINTAADGDLGTIHWFEAGASSLSELVTRLIQKVDSKLLDEQIANALLTGIVAETDRFSNEKTSSETMSASAALMSAGANQQLVASNLQENGQLALNVKDSSNGMLPPPVDPQSDDGSMDITHDEGATAESLPSEMPQSLPAEEPAEPNNLSPGARLMTEPPTLGGRLTANTEQEGLDPSTDPFSMPTSEPPQMLSHQPQSPATGSVPDATQPAGPPLIPEPAVTPPAPEPSPAITSQLTPPPPAWVPPQAPPEPAADLKTEDTLTEIEATVNSPHLTQASEAGLDSARSQVDQALNDINAPVQPQPAQSLNAKPLGVDLHPSDLPSDPTPPPTVPPAQNPEPTEPQDPNAPPPVPPPIPFQFGNPPPQQ